jgi:hypothetical protein
MSRKAAALALMLITFIACKHCNGQAGIPATPREEEGVPLLNFFHAMSEFIQHLQPVLGPLARSWGLPGFQPDLLNNLDFCDQMLQALDTYPLPDPVRQEIYGSTIGPGPGGLLAFFWLARHHHLDRPLMSDYLACLQPGPACPGALSETQFLPLLQWLLEEFWQEQTEDPGLCQLLNSHAITAKARCAGLRLVVTSPQVSCEARLRLAHWACRSHQQLPLANAELHKAGFFECVHLGEPPAQVLQQALAQLNGPLSGSAGQALLDLVQAYTREIPPILVHQALLALKDTSSAGTRRRAFQLLEKTHGEEWIHLGLRDRDAAVRGWALLRSQQRRNQSA